MKNASKSINAIQGRRWSSREPYKLIDSTFLSTSIASLQAIPSFFIVIKNIRILSYWGNFRGWPYNHKNKAISNVKMWVDTKGKKIKIPSEMQENKICYRYASQYEKKYYYEAFMANVSPCSKYSELIVHITILSETIFQNWIRSKTERNAF